MSHKNWGLSEWSSLRSSHMKRCERNDSLNCRWKVSKKWEVGVSLDEESSWAVWERNLYVKMNEDVGKRSRRCSQTYYMPIMEDIENLLCNTTHNNSFLFPYHVSLDYILWLFQLLISQVYKLSLQRMPSS